MVVELGVQVELDAEELDLCAEVGAALALDY